MLCKKPSTLLSTSLALGHFWGLTSGWCKHSPAAGAHVSTSPHLPLFRLWETWGRKRETGSAHRWENPCSFLFQSFATFCNCLKNNKIKEQTAQGYFLCLNASIFCVLWLQLSGDGIPPIKAFSQPEQKHTLLVCSCKGFECLLLAWHPWDAGEQIPAALFIYFNQLLLASSRLCQKDLKLPQSNGKHAVKHYEAWTRACQISDPHESR